MAPSKPGPAAFSSKTPTRTCSCKPSTPPPPETPWSHPTSPPGSSRPSPASSAQAAPPQPIDPLTEREEEVLAEVARGKTNAEIADELFISNSTVKTHVARLMTKLQARNRVEIVIWAYETGRVG